MTGEQNEETLMTAEERVTLTELAAQDVLEAEDQQRLQALLLIDAGETHTTAATQVGLTRGQVNYALRKFRAQRVEMFAPAEVIDRPEIELPATDEVALVIEDELELEPEPDMEPEQETEPSFSESDEARVSISSKQFRAMMAELNKFADRIQQQVKFTPPPFSADEMLQLMQKLTPERLTIVNDMQNMLANRPDAKELFDADTWRGMIYIVTYTAQNESKSLFGKAKETVSKIPGVSLGVRTSKAIFNKLPGSSLVVDVLGMLEGASPKDLLDPETWRGMIYLINYSLQYELEQMKARLLGTTDGEEDEDDVADLAVE
ncbi:MAG: helix-turn-helix domain-containing protein [Anaerolineales bacterium]|nr:helix-turn-helix domain-containing protein [Anaerolineales bacterium]